MLRVPWVWCEPLLEPTVREAAPYGAREYIIGPVSDNDYSALMLPGGGARCAYQVGVLQALAEQWPNRHGPFQIICGTSGGAINAAVLASHAHRFAHGVQRLGSFWGGLECAHIYRTDAPEVLGSALRWALSLASGGVLRVAPKALLDNQPLRAFLEQTLHLEGIEEALAAGALKAVAVTASAYSSARAVSFYQADTAVQPWSRSRRCGAAAQLTVAHLLASSALPLLFPAERVGTEYFGDGGMRSHAPLSPAIHLGARRILVIGTRDEQPDPTPSSPVPYPAPGEIAGYLLDTIFMDTLTADLSRLQRINRTLALVPPVQRAATALQQIDTLVIRPSRDLRELTHEHVNDIPWSVKLLLRTLGGWGRDWRMASYLLFEAPYCQALMELGYRDGKARAQDMLAFLQPG